MSDIVKIQRALLSVTDKTGVVEFARGLSALGIELISSGGTAKHLRDAGLTVKDVSDVTDFPEMLDGRVKTLHPNIHGGLLAKRDDKTHMQTIAEHNIQPIDLVVVNLYAFEKTVTSGADFDACVENIDIGGPSMVRSAAKNFKGVAVVTDSATYDAILEEMQNNKGGLTLARRKQLAADAFNLTASYDAAIQAWMAKQVGDEDDMPQRLVCGGARKQVLRYGENPHQKAALYKDASTRPGVVNATQLMGKELSYNNINDTNAAFELVAEFEKPAAVVVKHANPCGVATGGDVLSAYEAALAADPVSAFGGIVALNQSIDKALAEKLVKKFLEVIIAPRIDDDALAVLKAKENLRLLITETMPDPHEARPLVKSIAGGYLVQNIDNQVTGENAWDVVTKRQPTQQELDDLQFGFTVVKHVKSNAIVLAKNDMTVGVGAGQMNRVGAARIAIEHAGVMAKEAGEDASRAIGSVLASDAFLPFPDTVEIAAEAGITAIVQPGGSKKDPEVIAAADAHDIAMVFTGMRHFLH